MTDPQHLDVAPAAPSPAAPSPAALDAARPVAMRDVEFSAPACRNCGASFATPFCGQCGQRRVDRIGTRDLLRETWIRWRLFDVVSMRTAWRLFYAPGRVAREYVLGMRADHFNPLKLLLVALLLLALALARANYLQSQQYAEVNETYALIASYGKWSFSLGLAAILAASLIVFPRRLGYNPVEHVVLAAYTHTVILLLVLLNLLPTLVFTDPAFVHAHKVASSYYLFAIKGVVVALAFAQFFLVDLRRQWWRLLAAVLLYIAVNWALTRAYARFVLWIATSSIDTPDT